MLPSPWIDTVGVLSQLEGIPSHNDIEVQAPIHILEHGIKKLSHFFYPVDGGTGIDSVQQNGQRLVSPDGRDNLALKCMENIAEIQSDLLPFRRRCYCIQQIILAAECIVLFGILSAIGHVIVVHNIDAHCRETISQLLQQRTLH